MVVGMVFLQIPAHAVVAVYDSDTYVGEATSVDFGSGLSASLSGSEVTVVKDSDFAADAEASDTYVISLTPAPTAYTTGMRIIFTATTANTGACTINVNGLGAKNLLSLNNITPPDNYIEAASVVLAVYDGTSFQMIQPDANP